MPDELATLLAAEAPAEAVTPTEPATPAQTATTGIETQGASEWEDRFKGLQRVVSEKDRALSDLQKQVEELRLSSLSEDERDAYERRREADEISALRAENELLKLASNPKYASVYEPFTKLLRARTAEEQLEYLSALLAPKAPEEAPKGKPTAPPVDPNNPRRTTGITMPDGTEMTDTLAKMILDRASGLVR